MAQRDYVSRGRSTATRRKAPGRKKRSSPKVSKTVVALAVALLVIFIGGLYFITHNKPNETPLLSPTNNPRLGNGLPPKPEERWRYIKELENRQIGVSSPTEPSAGGEVNSKTELTNEQRQLLEKMQADMQQRPTQLAEVPYNEPLQAPSGRLQQQIPAPPTPQTSAHNPFNDGAIPAQPTPTQRQQQIPQTRPQPTPAQVQPPVAKPELKPKSETKTEAATAIAKPPIKPESKPEQKQKWMVQCGSFRAADQAESVRAQLAFDGIESRITAGGGWNRVVLGPYSNRVAADKTLARLKSIGMSSCIPLAVGG